MPGIAELEITIADGKPVAPLPEGDRYLGFVFARGKHTRRGRAGAARRVEPTLAVEIAP